MYYYQLQKHHCPIMHNQNKDSNYICSLSLKGSIVFSIIRAMKERDKRAVIASSKEDITALVMYLEKCLHNHSYFKMIVNNYKELLTQDDFYKGLIEITAVFHFILEEPSLENNKIFFIEMSITEGWGWK